MRILGVLGGVSLSVEDLRSLHESHDETIAADHGFDHLVNAGLVPDLFVGDRDSVLTPLPPEITIYPDTSQDSTDTDKLIEWAKRRGGIELTLACAHGGRPDHEFAVLHSLTRTTMRSRIAHVEHWIHVIIGPTEQEFRVEVGETVSLLPLGECQGVDFAGVEWPLEQVELSPSRLTSISNRAAEPTIRVKVEAGSAALYLPRPCS